MADITTKVCDVCGQHPVVGTWQVSTPTGGHVVEVDTCATHNRQIEAIAKKGRRVPTRRASLASHDARRIGRSG